jgi:hypothetical protein
MLAVAASALGAGAAAAAPPRPQASFEWHLPSRYSGATDERGRIIETQPEEVRRGPWKVYLRVTGDACKAGAKHRWETASGKKLRRKRLGPCRYVLRLAREGTYRVRLRVTNDGIRLAPATEKIVVRDWLIVAIGDSVASGEGVPETPSFFAQALWQSARCHRSSRAGVARAARQIEADDGRSSVTFVHLACSGAGVGEGLLRPYAGAVPPRDEPPLEPQVSALERIARKRQVDAVLISAGANDVNFSGIASFCAQVPNEDCFTEPLPRRFGGDGVRTPREAVHDKLRVLRRAYLRLGARLARVIRPSRVYVTEYFDPTHDEHGATCDGFFGAIGKGEVEQALSQILAPLNATVTRAAEANGWMLVDGIAPTFRTHGYCAGRRAWVSTLEDSLRSLGGIAGRHRGTLHPNAAGHETIGVFVTADLERDLFPNRDFPPRPFPEPAAEEESGLSPGLVVALVLAALLLGPAAGALAVACAPLILLGALLWWGRGTFTPFLLGAGLGVLFVLNPRGIASLAAKPFLTLAKTLRPLLLPLLVVIAVGAVSFSLAAQLLITAALAVLAWRLILVPEDEKSAKELKPPHGLLGRLVLQGGIVALLGLAVVVLSRLLGLDNPYLAAVSDLVSGLLLLALLLWVGAIALRLYSFATTLLRGLVSVALGLALLVVTVGGGVLPGKDAVAENWPLEAGILVLIALLLLGLDAVLGVRARVERKPRGDERWASTRNAADVGVSTAAAAALVLALSTIGGLIDAEDRGDALNPPEEEVAEIRAPAPTDDEGGMELARRYAPVLAFSDEERWAPVRVDSYVAEAKLSGPPKTRERVEKIAKLPSRCREVGRSSCYELTIECERGDLPCAKGRLRAPGRLYRDGGVYVRVLRKGDPPEGEPRDVFAQVGPFRHELEILIQYWYFYRFNEWRAPLFAGLLVQRHEADWEAVTIGLDEERKPLFVADSAHCAGSWLAWDEVEASTRLPGPRIHPLVAVAEGSHANYPDPEDTRSPDWTSCAGGPAGVTTALSYASNIRDRTEFGWLWYPPADGWIPARPTEPPMSFAGAWGADDLTLLRNFAVHELHKGEAPKSPPLQGLWQDPVRSIFCGKYEPQECVRDEE